MVLRVTYGTFETLVAEAERARVALENAIMDMNRTVTGQLTEGWQGAAKESYVASQQQWDIAANDLYQVLVSVEKTLQNCEIAYANMETQNTAMFAK